MAVSEDNGATWSPLEAIGNWGGIVTMASVLRLRSGNYLAMFHDDGRFISKGGAVSKTMQLYQVISADGGLTWGARAWSTLRIPSTSANLASYDHRMEPGWPLCFARTREPATPMSSSRTTRAHVVSAAGIASGVDRRPTHREVHPDGGCSSRSATWRS